MAGTLRTERLNLHYGKFHALKDVTLSVRELVITSIIGPSGCGKSTLLRCFNRMNELIDGTRVDGKVFLDDADIYAPQFPLTTLRKRVGMVFQIPNPFPLSVYDNIVYGLRVHRMAGPGAMDRAVERSLKRVFLWDELKDRLQRPATSLSPEQQQRLCIARTLAVEPEVLLMDEPCSKLDPVATLKIEDLMRELKKQLTIVIVTHNMQQAARASDDTGFMLLGELVEFGTTGDVFINPKDRRTEDYVTGRYG